MWLQRTVVLCFVFTTSLAIYLPTDNIEKKSQNSAGIKTLDWQGQGPSQSSVTVHHNYSKVYHTNHPNGTTYTLTHNESHQNQNRQPKNNTQDESYSGRSSTPYFVDQHQGFDQQSQSFDQQSHSFDQQSDNFDQQYSNFDQQSQNFDQQSENFDQQSQNFDQQSQNFDQQSQNFDQQSQSFDQQSSSHQQDDHQPSSSDQIVQYAIPDRRPKINDHLGGFGQQTINDNLDFSQSKPKKLQFQVKDKEWKIQVYKTCPKGQTGQFVYEYSCSEFLNCWKGRGHVQNCGPGTLFNPKTLECDYPEKVSCVTGTTQAIMEDARPLSATLQASCPAGFTGMIPHYTVCSKFIQCANGQQIEMDCPPGTMFDIKSNMCDFPYKSECASGQSGAQTTGQQHPGYSNKFVVIKPFMKNVTYDFQSGINNQLGGFTGTDSHGRTYYISGTSVQQAGGRQDNFGHGQQGGQNYQGQHSQINDHLGEFSNTNQQASGQWSSTTGRGGRHESFAQNHQSSSGQNYQGQSTHYLNGQDSQGGHDYQTGGAQTNQYGQQWSQGQGQNTHSYGQNAYGQSQTSHGQGQNSYGQGQTGYEQGRQVYGQAQTHGQSGHGHGYGQNTYGYGQSSQSASQYGGQYVLMMSEAEMLSMGFEGDMCKNKVGVFEHPSNCSVFLYCENDHLYKGMCTQGTSYNPTKKICEYYHCQKRPGEQNRYLGEAKCPEGASGLYAHPTICEKFLNCDHGATHIQDCGPGTVFNPAVKVCDWPYNVKCTSQPGRTGKLISETGTNAVSHNTEVSRFFGVDENFCSTREGFYQDMKNCSRFFNCRHGVLSMGICHQGSYYNPSTNNCDNNYRCHLNDASQFKCSGNGVFPHPADCAKYMQCSNGKAVVMSCGTGTLFNPISKVCDFPQNVRCGTGINYQSGYGVQVSYNQQSGQNQWGSGQHQNQGTSQWQAGQNQQQTGHGQWSTGQSQNQGSSQWQAGQNQQQTGHGQWSTGQNGHGQNQGSYNQNAGGNGQNSYGQSQFGQNEQFTCSSDGMFSHPSDCSKYMQCANGKAVIMSCGPGTLFNPISKVCDFPHNVRCGSGVNYQSGQSGQASYNQRPGQNQWSNVQTSSGQNQVGQNQNQGGSQWQTGHNHQQPGFNFHTQQTGQWQGQSYHAPDPANQTAGSKPTFPKQQSRGHWTTGVDTEFGESNIEQNFVNVGQTTKWTPPIQKTDPNADYVFEYEDIIEVDGVEDQDNTCDFKCSDHKCIKKSALCDGLVDCSNGDDEKNCEKYIRQFELTKNTKMAVREKTKFPNTTLTLCAKQCLEADGFKCKSFNYRKNDGMCFILEKNVGQVGSLFSLPNYDYYEYKKFSMNCTNKFVCGNLKCIENIQVCNGVFDCVDREDEKNCKPEQIGYQIRLVGAESSYQGAIQVSAFGNTGYVCDDQFGLRDAHVVCKELGFDLGALEVKGNSHFSETSDNNTLYMMDDVNCFGNETSLKDCDFSGWGVHNCKPKEVVGVICKRPQEICSKDYWKCETGSECIPLTFMCDGVFDCTDRSDEASQYCESAIELRLTGGHRPSEGRLEVKYHGTWGTICDDDFNDDAAKVACRYLGYKGPARVKKDGFYGPGTGPIWLDQVFCQGNETTVQECDHWDWGKHNCDHDEDVGVACDDYNIGGTPRHTKLPNQNALLPKNLFSNRCGYRNDDIFLDNSDVHFRVVKGSLAQKGHYPWQASIRVKGQTKHEHWCGAVVISESFVLTAAHCLHNYKKGGFVVVAGDYDRQNDEGTEQVANIEEFYLHEEFRKGTKMNNDIALVKLKSSGFNLTKDVQPICLPPANFNDEEGLNCTISGFGSIQSGKAVASQELRAGWVPIQPREVCTMPHVYGESITDGMICAGSLDEGVDACDGDSGGPLACLKDGLFTLVGVISWGQHCGYANKPGVYVKIAHYRDWIDHTMSKHS